jgi:hypothetical protein
LVKEERRKCQQKSGSNTLFDPFRTASSQMIQRSVLLQNLTEAKSRCATTQLGQLAA